MPSVAATAAGRVRRRPVRRAVALAALAGLGMWSPAPAAAGDWDDSTIGQVVVADFDADGTSDIAVGLPDLNEGKFTRSGAVRAYSGKSGKLLWKFTGGNEGQKCGSSLTLAGDLDADKVIDLAVGFPWSRHRSHIQLVSGRDGTLLQRLGTNFPDSFADHIHGAYIVSFKERGADWKILARTGNTGRWWAMNAELGESEGFTDNFGDSHGTDCVATSVGDLNQDLFHEVALCTPNADVAGAKGAGKVRFMNGRPLAGMRGEEPDPQFLGEIVGTRAGEALGSIQSPAGDWDGDAKPDLLFGTRGESKGLGTPWTLRVLSPLDKRELAKFVGPDGEKQLGAAVVVQDVNGDGKADIVVGVPSRNRGDGALEMRSGADGSVLWCVNGGKRERLGEGIHLAGLSGEGSHLASLAGEKGISSVWVLAPGAARNGSRGDGSVRLVSAKTGEVLTKVNPYLVK